MWHVAPLSTSQRSPAVVSSRNVCTRCSGARCRAEPTAPMDSDPLSSHFRDPSGRRGLGTTSAEQLGFTTWGRSEHDLEKRKAREELPQKSRGRQTAAPSLWRESIPTRTLRPQCDDASSDRSRREKLAAATRGESEHAERQEQGRERKGDQGKPKGKGRGDKTPKGGNTPHGSEKGKGDKDGKGKKNKKKKKGQPGKGRSLYELLFIAIISLC
eukprot:s2592_g1.t1